MKSIIFGRFSRLSDTSLYTLILYLWMWTYQVVSCNSLLVTETGHEFQLITMYPPTSSENSNHLNKSRSLNKSIQNIFIKKMNNSAMSFKMYKAISYKMQILKVVSYETQHIATHFFSIFQTVIYSLYT